MVPLPEPAPVSPLASVPLPSTVPAAPEPLASVAPLPEPVSVEPVAPEPLPEPEVSSAGASLDFEQPVADKRRDKQSVRPRTDMMHLEQDRGLLRQPFVRCKQTLNSSFP